ncbi:MAG: hypothetical protein HKO56_01915 [Bacteroidia bacterium]|nr:hypothetical protein [Bacteroidia bacterium]NNM15385.1 hypothetical protein [Bacteroidia bacterium]
MKTLKFIPALLILFFSVLCICSCTTPHSETESVELDDLAFDSTLAAQLGADDYGMKKYVIAFLKRGPNRSQDSVTRAELQKGHMENIGRLADERILVLAGPFFGDDDLRGIYIFDVQTIEEAEALTNTDPAIQQGSLIMELKPWYGSAALMQVNDIHSKLAKIKF